MKKKISAFIISLAMCMGAVSAVREFENLKAEAIELFAKTSVYLLNLKGDDSKVESSKEVLIAKVNQEEVELEDEILATLDVKRYAKVKTKTAGLGIVNQAEIEAEVGEHSEELSELENETAEGVYSAQAKQRAKAKFWFAFNYDEKRVAANMKKVTDMRRVVILQRVSAELNRAGVIIPQIVFDEAETPKPVPCPNTTFEKRGEKTFVPAPESIK